MPVKVKVAQSCLTLCNPMDYIVHGILQARIPEWVAFPFSRGSSQPKDRTQVSCIAGRFFTNWAIREALCASNWGQISFSCVIVHLSVWLSENTMNCFYLSIYLHFHQLVVMNRKVEKYSTLPGSQALQLQESAMHTGFFPNSCWEQWQIEHVLNSRFFLFWLSDSKLDSNELQKWLNVI